MKFYCNSWFGGRGDSIILGQRLFRLSLSSRSEFPFLSDLTGLKTQWRARLMTAPRPA